MKFNGKHFTEVNPYIIGVTVQGTNNPLAPDFRVRQSTISGRDGGIFYGESREPKEIPIRLRVMAPTLSDKQQAFRDIAEWIDTDEPKPLIFDFEDDKQDLCVLTEGAAVENISTFSANVSFVLTNFEGYSESIEETVFDELNHTLEGTAETDFKAHITITENAGSVVFKLDGKEITLNAGLIDGDAVVFDSKRRKATVNGVPLPVSVTSDWFKLPTGEFDIEIQPVSSTFEIEYKARWK